MSKSVLAIAVIVGALLAYSAHSLYIESLGIGRYQMLQAPDNHNLTMMDTATGTAYSCTLFVDETGADVGAWVPVSRFRQPTDKPFQAQPRIAGC